jgi:hypothetical protein
MNTASLINAHGIPASPFIKRTCGIHSAFTLYTVYSIISESRASINKNFPQADSIIASNGLVLTRRSSLHLTCTLALFQHHAWGSSRCRPLPHLILHIAHRPTDGLGPEYTPHTLATMGYFNQSREDIAHLLALFWSSISRRAVYTPLP